MCVKFGLDPMSNFGFLWIFDIPRLIELINQYSKRYRFVVESRIKKLSEGFFACASEDAVSKVWC